MTPRAADLTAADPTAVVLSWLRTHTRVLSEFGGADHVSGVVEAPWPRLRVMTGVGGDPRRLQLSMVGEVRLEVYSDPLGRPGEAALRRLLMVAAQAVYQLADRDHASVDPIVHRVEAIGMPAPDPLSLAISTQALTSGQSRWSINLAVTISPPEDTI